MREEGEERGGEEGRGRREMKRRGGGRGSLQFISFLGFIQHCHLVNIDLEQIHNPAQTSLCTRSTEQPTHTWTPIHVPLYMYIHVHGPLYMYIHVPLIMASHALASQRDMTTSHDTVYMIAQ